MIEKEKKNRIGELRESGLTVKEIAKTLEISESSVKKYSSRDPDKDNKLDEKISDEMTKIMLVEGYDFEDEIKPIIYALKDEVNTMDITLWNHINDIKNNTKMFLRLTDNPIRLYYIFMLFASNLNLITDHIEAKTLIEAVDNFIDREVSMEDAENYIDTWNIISEEEYEELKEKILNAKNEYNKIIRGKTEHKDEQNKRLRETNANQQTQINQLKEAIEEALEKNNILSIFSQKAMEGAEIQKKEIKDLKTANQELKKTVVQTNNERAILEEAISRITNIFPEETLSIIREVVKNEKLQRSETPIS